MVAARNEWWKKSSPLIARKNKTKRRGLGSSKVTFQNMSQQPKDLLLGLMTTAVNRILVNVS